MTTQTPQLDQIIIREFLDRFQDERLKTNSPATNRAYMKDLEIMLKDSLDMRLANLTDYQVLVDKVAKEVQEIKATAGNEEGYKPRTANRKISVANAFLKYVRNYCLGLFGETPQTQHFKTLGVNKTHVIPMTREQFDQLMASM